MGAHSHLRYSVIPQPSTHRTVEPHPQNRYASCSAKKSSTLRTYTSAKSATGRRSSINCLASSTLILSIELSTASAIIGARCTPAAQWMNSLASASPECHLRKLHSAPKQLRRLRLEIIIRRIPQHFDPVIRWRQLSVIELDLHVDDVRDPLSRHLRHVLGVPNSAPHRNPLGQPRDVHSRPISSDAPSAPPVSRFLRQGLSRARRRAGSFHLRRPNPDRYPIASRHRSASFYGIAASKISSIRGFASHQHFFLALFAVLYLRTRFLSLSVVLWLRTRSGRRYRGLWQILLIPPTGFSGMSSLRSKVFARHSSSALA